MSKHYRELFARHLRIHRLLRGWSQEKLAEKAGLHRTYIGAVERGERNICLNNIVKISTAFDIEITELFIDTHSLFEKNQCRESAAIYSAYHRKPQANATNIKNDAYIRHFAIYRRSTVHTNFPVMLFHEHISKEAPGTQYQTSSNQSRLVAGNAC